MFLGLSVGEADAQMHSDPYEKKNKKEVFLESKQEKSLFANAAVLFGQTSILPHQENSRN